MTDMDGVGRGESVEVPASSAARSRCSILIVDDAIEARTPLGEFLRRRGYVVFEAADADQALNVLNSRLDIDVLVTDVQMPGSMDGLALARWVRRTWPALRVLVVSGMDVAAQLTGEGIACFRKPAASKDLLAALPGATADTP